MTVLRLALLMVVLVAGAMLAADFGPVDPPTRAVAAPSDASSLTGEARAPPPPPLETLAETRTRPLFVADRRPPAPPAPPSPPAPAPPSVHPVVLDRYAVIGDFVIAGRRRLMLAPLAGGPSLRLAEGERLDDWTAVELRPDTLVLDRDGERRVFKIIADPPGAQRSAR
jgi:hypothetical protein